MLAQRHRLTKYVTKRVSSVGWNRFEASSNSALFYILYGTRTILTPQLGTWLRLHVQPPAYTEVPDLYLS